MNMTRGQVEARISEAIIKFEKEYLGRGPRETRTHLFEDMVIIRLRGVLTPAEEQLSKTTDGAVLVKQMRIRLLEGARLLLETMIAEITGAQVISLHTDISTKRGERLIVFTLAENIENRFNS